MKQNQNTLRFLVGALCFGSTHGRAKTFVEKQALREMREFGDEVKYLHKKHHHGDSSPDWLSPALFNVPEAPFNATRVKWAVKMSTSIRPFLLEAVLAAVTSADSILPGDKRGGYQNSFTDINMPKVN
jgi:hypothetical protein